MLESRIDKLRDPESFLQSPQGHQHVWKILQGLCSLQGQHHRDSLACAFLNGVGYGRFDPNAVLLFYDVVAELNGYHVQVLQWCYKKQGDLSVRDRFAKPMGLAALTKETPSPAAVVQKVVADLARYHALVDPTVNAIGQHWGIHWFTLTSFGLELACYLEDPSAFTNDECRVLESPFPEPVESA